MTHIDIGQFAERSKTLDRNGAQGKRRMGRRGPKAKPKKREPNGRASRKKVDVMTEFLKGIDVEQREAQGVALSARNRVHGVAPALTKDQMAGSFIGRLCLQGEITQAQYHAAQSWLGDCHRYAIVMGGPKGMGAVDLNATHGRNDAPEDVERTRQVRQDHAEALEAVQRAQNEAKLSGVLYAALYYVVNRDLELYHLLGSLRLALNALVRHYGWTRLEAEAA